MVTVICAGCGRPFEAKRRDARTCSATCRKRAERTRKQPAVRRRKRKAAWMREHRAAERAAIAADRPPAPTRPADLVGFAESLEVTQGEHAGELLTVLPWQAAWLRSVEGAPGGSGRARGGAADGAAVGFNEAAGGEIGLSVPAGSGKTTIAATVAAAAVAGPLAKPRADVLLVAGSWAQATIAFDHARAFLQGEIEADPERWRVLRSEQRALIEDRDTGSRLVAREANARTLHGTAPVLILADEPAQWMPTQREAIYSALRSRLGKIPGAKLVAIGTKPDDAAHWFTRLLARNGVTYAADPEADWADPATWHQANPSLAHFPALEATYQREADEAAADPSLLPAFKALRLNLGTADHEIAVLIEAEAWQRCEVDILPAPAGPAIWGVDLSGGDALAAVACYWPGCGRLEAIAAFPELPDLADRGRRDGADYQRMADDGDLLVMGRRVVDVPELIGAALERWGMPARIVADHHQQRELRQSLEDADFPPAALILTGMGWADGPPRVRAFRKAVGGGRVAVRPRLLIRQAMANARTVSDSMHAEKVIKGGVSGRKRTARDDVAVAALLAVSEGARLPAPPSGGLRYFVA